MLLSSALAVVALVACGGGSDSSPTPDAAGNAAAAVPQAVAASDQQMVIECIFFDGRIYRTEADEYVQLLNMGDTPVDLEGWRVVNATDGAPSFTFPSHTVMPGDRVRVYNNQDHLIWGDFSFHGSFQVWRNRRPDVAALFNPQGQEVSTRTYPPGCEA